MANKIEVKRRDLEVLQAALVNAHHLCVAQDLVRQYQQLSEREQASALTVYLKSAVDITNSLLEVEEEEEVEETSDE